MAVDCDDTDAELNTVDFDGDNFTTCDGDCNDELDYQYPGAAYNEPPPLDTECLIDEDGDGYALPMSETCFVLDMQDSWGDGWNGAELTI